MKYLKITLKFILAFNLIIVLLLGLVYANHHKELPYGQQGEEADQLAGKMLQALNYEGYKEIRELSWTFSSLGRERHFKWQKKKGLCTVAWDSISVDLDLKNLKKSNIKINNIAYKGEKEKDLIYTAESKFNNDSFWLVAPFKLFDKGVERRRVILEDGSDALLVTYKSGGNTPGDSYLWLLDKDFKPKAFNMWVSISPIGGLEASWEKWTETTQGVFLPQLHQIFFLDLNIQNLTID